MKPDSETWQSWKPINSNSISKTHKRSLTYAARGVCLAPSVLWSTRGPFKRIRKGTYSVCWPSPSKQKGPVLHRRGSPSEACMHPGWWHRRVGGDPCPEPPYSQTCCVPRRLPASEHLAPPKKNNNNTRSYDSAKSPAGIPQVRIYVLPDPAGFALVSVSSLSLSLSLSVTLLVSLSLSGWSAVLVAQGELLLACCNRPK